ncbi:MAG TPA: hypothetical protein VD866_13390 [Urbifossiella sp.]|nr:hypothetical protein [Urbifossiella sp.]
MRAIHTCSPPNRRPEPGEGAIHLTNGNASDFRRTLQELAVAAVK